MPASGPRLSVEALRKSSPVWGWNAFGALTPFAVVYRGSRQSGQWSLQSHRKKTQPVLPVFFPTTPVTRGVIPQIDRYPRLWPHIPPVRMKQLNPFGLRVDIRCALHDGIEKPLPFIRSFKAPSADQPEA